MSRAEGQTGRRSAWWEEFFTGLWLDFQLEAHTDEQTRLEADRIEELLQLPAPERVLDVPCGEGRIAVELAARLPGDRRRSGGAAPSGCTPTGGHQATGDHPGAAGHA